MAMRARAVPARARPLFLLLSVLLGLALFQGCRPNLGGRTVIVQADGKEIPLLTTVTTVREALAEAGVTIDADDRAEPDLWVQIANGMTIRVLRVQEEIIVEREVVPYRQQTIKSEGLATGEQKLLQAGKNGQAEITYRIQFEDGVEVGRSAVNRVVIQEAVDQITVVGVEGMVDSVQVPGSIAYLSGGNAWLMRVTSGGRHPLNTGGELDGHVFALSPDGTYLLYTVPTQTVEFDGPFNDLYVLNTVVVDEKPLKLDIQNVLWAGWSPDGRQVAYSTGVKGGSPGWKAKNDLWIASLFDSQNRLAKQKSERALGAQSSGEYSWWGAQYAWSPDGQKVAYARPDQVGYINLKTGAAFPLAPFTPLNTHSDWVWVPTPTWSPDSLFIACMIHNRETGRPDEDSQQFEIWAFDLDKTVRARLTDAVGMWSAPRWSPASSSVSVTNGDLVAKGDSLIAYAEATMPGNSYDSEYVLKVMDRDGSNKQAIYPLEGQAGLALPLEFEWSPDGSKLVLLRRGDLYLYDMVSGQVHQLTGDGQCQQVEWAK